MYEPPPRQVFTNFTSPGQKMAHEQVEGALAFPDDSLATAVGQLRVPPVCPNSSACVFHGCAQCGLYAHTTSSASRGRRGVALPARGLLNLTFKFKLNAG
jgi:hypothetical protein